MPIYEYLCMECRKAVSVITLRASDGSEAKCPHCGGTDLKKLVSRFATVRSEEQRLESLMDPSALGSLDENDPSSMARWMKKASREMGEDLDEGEIDQMVEEASKASAGGEDDGSPS